jgi:ketosteroid isomerase-like protein
MLKMLFILIFGFQGLFTTLSALESEGSQKTIKERLQNLAEAINHGNLDALSSFWTNDAEYTKPATGEVIKGKNNIDQFLKKSAKEIKQRNLRFTFKPGNIDFPDADTAIVQGVTEIIDKGALLQRTARRIVFVKQNGGWYINNVSEIEIPPPPPVFIRLKDLEWLIGNWIDKDANVTITYSNRWDKFKSFIIQHFKMDVYGVETLNGTQIIGWDPLEKKIHSWVYDSDGGFGQGIWSRNGDSWQATINYVLSDGKKATATHIYRKINNTSYSYSSIDRKVDGKAIPDVEPVTVVKEE